MDDRIRSLREQGRSRRSFRLRVRRSYRTRPPGYKDRRNHEYSEVERLLQSLDQSIEVTSRNRIQPRCRLVKKQNFRIQRERPGKRSALGHATGQLSRKFLPSFGLKPTISSLALASSANNGSER